MTRDGLRATILAMTGGDRRRMGRLYVRYRALFPYMKALGAEDEQATVWTLAALFDLEVAENAAEKTLARLPRGNGNPRLDARLFAAANAAPKRMRTAAISAVLGKNPSQEAVRNATRRVQHMVRKAGLTKASG